MDFLIAILAFATVMILLSTLVMMIVNGINGVVRLRSRTLERSMRLLYEDVIAPRIGETPSKASSKSFARELLSNPSLRAPGSIVERTWFGPKDFDRLSSRSFVEQFARTRVGQHLASQNPMQLTEHLESVLYQFERYSDAANTYFLRRSKVISIVAAIVVAFALNIDSVRLFSGFLQDRELASSFASLGNTLQDDAARGDELDDEYKRVLVEQLASAQTSGLAIGPTQYPFCQTLYDITGITDLSSGEEEALKLGRDPRCQEDRYVSVAHTGLVAPLFSRGRTDIIGRFTGDRDARMQAQQEEQAAEAGAVSAVDVSAVAPLLPNADGFADPDGALEIEDGAAANTIETTAEAAPSGIAAQPDPTDLATMVPDTAESVIEQDVIVMLLWILSVFVSGGLIGLGAPFWAKAYGQIAALVPAMKVIAPLVSDRSTRLGGNRAPAGATVYRDRSRDRANREEDEILRTRDSMREAFDHSLPPAQSTSAPPVGMRLGDSSATSISGAAAGTEPGSAPAPRPQPEGNAILPTGPRPRRRLPNV